MAGPVAKGRDPEGTGPAALRVLREPGILHLPRLDGEPFCGTTAPLTAGLHPGDHAAVWCSDCLRAGAASSP